MKKKIIKGLITVLLLVLVVIWIYRGNTLIITANHQMSDEEIPVSFEGFTIVQVSDLHNAEFGKEQSRLMAAIREANPDIIVVTGDLIDSNRTDIDMAMCFVEQAVQIAPVYYVTGNHETYVPDSYSLLKEKMLDIGVDILEDEAVMLERDGEYIQLMGVGDVQLSDKKNETAGNPFERKLVGLKEDGIYTILLSHRPELFETYCRARINLVFSGHAHGGQFRIPLLGGVIAPNQGLFPTYTEGSYEKDDTTMIVSRGLGNSVVPVRVNNPPEIVVVTLHHTKE